MSVPESQEIAALFALEIQAEQRREAWSRRTAARHAGVCWSGLGAADFEPRDQDALLAEARAKLTRRQAWRRSPAGQFLSAIVDSQRTARAAHDVGERARDAASRDALGEAAVCAAMAEELELQAGALMSSARAARAAAVRLAEPGRPDD